MAQKSESRLQKAFHLGPTFSRDLEYNNKLEEKMLLDSRNSVQSIIKIIPFVYFSGMMYVGDTLYQAPETEAVMRFDLKNPKLESYKPILSMVFTRENKFSCVCKN